MTQEMSQEQLLQQVLERVSQNNLATKPGTPLAELRTAIEGALGALPPLKFEEVSQALEDTEAADKLIRRAPEIIGWNADRIVEWVEELSKKLE